MKSQEMPSGNDGQTEEVWKDIPTRTNGFQVSTKGRVRSKSRYIINKKGIQRFWNGRILYLGLGGSGYFCVVLDRKNYWVHKLVARAFIPNPENKRCINHKDRNKENNCVENLEWVTHKENMKHLMESLGQDERIATMSFSKRMRREIEEELLQEKDVRKHSELCDHLSKKYQVSRETIGKIRMRLGIRIPSGARGERNGKVKWMRAKQAKQETFGL